jgi:amidase
MASQRIPAATCGLVTIKPGRAVVPAGIGEGAWFGMSENGPLATTVEDTRLLLAVLADGDLPPSSARGGQRVAVSLRSPIAGVAVSAPFRAAAREAAGVLMKAGHQVRRADPPYPMSLGLTALANWTAGTSVDARDLDPRSLTRRTRVHAAIGRRLAGQARKGRAREELRGVLDPFFERYDILLTPALARRSPEAAPWHERGWLRNILANTACSPFTPPWNLTGWPAMSVQLVGRPGAETELLDLAAQLESLRPWRRTAPLD